MEVAATIDNKTIAVIPFVDMSQEGDQEWFSDGMMEEILNHLVQIEDLKVTSRTSAMRFKGSEKSLQEIGKELSVAHILEGSVRKQGNTVRINVKLIDVESDQRIWSNTYDRNLDDVFAIQSEVAQRVASELQAQVHPEVRIRIESQPTASTEAYNLYLQARFYLINFIQLEEARSLLERAIELDSEFALAHSGLGSYWMLRGIFLGDLDPLTTREKAIPPLQKAVQIDDQLGEAHGILSFVYLYFGWDFESAERERVIVAGLNPNQERPNLYVIMATGRQAKALELSKELVKNNPEDAVSWGTLALSY